ncbi:MAG: 1-deoxy-D-xylulose-5-phosphate reductoisomerase [Armatimonadota bacterium]
MPRRIAIVGSTGSIGQQALDVVRRFPESFSVVGLSTGRSVDALVRQVHEFRPAAVGIADAKQYEELRSALADTNTQVLAGQDADQIASLPEADLVLVASVGLSGLAPAVNAIRAGKVLAIANKESLVAAGELILSEARHSSSLVIPVDSEHSAVFQCLEGEDTASVRRLILTASGGAFRDRSLDEVADVTPAEALMHPTWRMGKKITVDSATLMNKGLEVIEAHRLFGVPVERIETVLHHQSIIHSMVEFTDGSVKAQMSLPDMRLPIQYALFYPQRGTWAPSTLDLAAIGCLTFATMDLKRYPCLRLAYSAARKGGTCPAVLSAADEVAVAAFLEGRLRFGCIPAVIEATLEAHSPEPAASLDVVLRADAWARKKADFCVRRLEV